MKVVCVFQPAQQFFYVWCLEADFLIDGSAKDKMNWKKWNCIVLIERMRIYTNWQRYFRIVWRKHKTTMTQLSVPLIMMSCCRNYLTISLTGHKNAIIWTCRASVRLCWPLMRRGCPNWTALSAWKPLLIFKAGAYLSINKYHNKRYSSACGQ